MQATTGTTASKSEVAWAYPTPVGLTLTSAAATIALGAKTTLTLHAADAADPEYPIGHLAGVSVGPTGAAVANRATLTTGAAGNAAARFMPNYTTTYSATFTPGVLSPQFTATPAQATVTVAVRARLTAHAGVPSAAGVVRVSGTFRPVRAGVPLALQQSSGGTWKAVARTQHQRERDLHPALHRARRRRALARALRRRRHERRRDEAAARARRALRPEGRPGAPRRLLHPDPDEVRQGGRRVEAEVTHLGA